MPEVRQKFFPLRECLDQFKTARTEMGIIYHHVVVIQGYYYVKIYDMSGGVHGDAWYPDYENLLTKYRRISKRLIWRPARLFLPSSQKEEQVEVFLW